MMNENQEAAYVMSMAACALIDAIGMAAANSQYPDDQPYQDNDFRALINKYGIHHNAVVEAFRPD